MASDYNPYSQYIYKGESFLEIHHPRKFIKTNFSTEEIEATKDPSDKVRDINRVSDITYGALTHLLKIKENWKRLKVLRFPENY